MQSPETSRDKNSDQISSVPGFRHRFVSRDRSDESFAFSDPLAPEQLICTAVFAMQSFPFGIAGATPGIYGHIVHTQPQPV
jgi:hypothetical protein